MIGCGTEAVVARVAKSLRAPAVAEVDRWSPATFSFHGKFRARRVGQSEYRALLEDYARMAEAIHDCVPASAYATLREFLGWQPGHSHIVDFIDMHFPHMLSTLLGVYREAHNQAACATSYALVTLYRGGAIRLCGGPPGLREDDDLLPYCGPVSCARHAYATALPYQQRVRGRE